MMHKISPIIATKERSDGLRKVQESLRPQAVGLAEVVVLDASRELIVNVMDEYCDITFRPARHRDDRTISPDESEAVNK